MKLNLLPAGFQLQKGGKSTKGQFMVSQEAIFSQGFPGIQIEGFH